MRRFILFLGQCALEIYEYIISVEWVSAYIHFVKNVCNVQAEKIALEYYMRSVLMKLYSVGTRQPSCGPRFGRIRTCWPDLGVKDRIRPCINYTQQKNAQLRKNIVLLAQFVILNIFLYHKERLGLVQFFCLILFCYFYIFVILERDENRFFQPVVLLIKLV